VWPPPPKERSEERSSPSSGKMNFPLEMACLMGEFRAVFVVRALALHYNSTSNLVLKILKQDKIGGIICTPNSEGDSSPALPRVVSRLAAVGVPRWTWQQQCIAEYMAVT